jgi:hypothetical protein
MAKTTFTLWRTKAGRILITCEQVLRDDTLSMITLYFDKWSKSPEGSVMLVPDTTYAGELDDEDMVLTVIKAGTAFAFEPQVVAGGTSEATILPEDAVGFSVDALVAAVGDRSVSPGEIAAENDWDTGTVMSAMRKDSRFEEVGVGVGRFQLTNDAFANRSAAQRSEE